MELRENLVHNPAFIYLYREFLRSKLTALIPDLVHIVSDYVIYRAPIPVVLTCHSYYDLRTFEGVFSSRQKAEAYLNNINKMKKHKHNEYLGTLSEEIISSILAVYEINIIPEDLDITMPIYILQNGNGYLCEDGWITNSYEKSFNYNRASYSTTEEWLNACCTSVDAYE